MPVWVPLADDYPIARHAAEQALAGRKNLRDFRPWRHDRAGAPKSSLDGARVSVLGAHRNHADFRRLRIGDGEQLDAIGLIKRAGFEPEQFVPIANIAAGSWLKQAAEATPAELDDLRAACREARIPRIDRRLPVVEPFRFDASILYPSRWLSIFKDINPSQSDAQTREWGSAHVRPLLKAAQGEPPAYVACLVADGDRMGAALDCLASAEENRKFSEALAGFPALAREIVEQQHRGSLIYAGGDDVLAFLPVATAPGCAADLAQKFGEVLRDAVKPDEPPTLSVGIGIGHFMEQMSVLLDLARRAERAAKQSGRDALTIIFDKRSGGERSVTLKWRDKPNPVERLRKDYKRLQESLSTGKVYELAALLRRFQKLPDKWHTQVSDALAAYAASALEDSGDGQSARLDDLGLSALPGENFQDDLAAAIDRLLVVRSLREAGFA